MRLKLVSALFGALAISVPAFGQAVDQPNEERLSVSGEGEGPLQSLPFTLALDPTPPSDLRELVEKLYDAIPQEHLARIASYYGHFGYYRNLRRYGAHRDFFRDLYIREILYAAFDAWGFTGDNFPLRDEIACVGREFVRSIGVQLGMRYTYLSQDGPIELRTNVAFAYSQAELISQRLFEICEERA